MQKVTDFIKIVLIHFYDTKLVQLQQKPNEFWNDFWMLGNLLRIRLEKWSNNLPLLKLDVESKYDIFWSKFQPEVQSPKWNDHFRSIWEYAFWMKTPPNSYKNYWKRLQNFKIPFKHVSRPSNEPYVGTVLDRFWNAY